MLQFKRACRQRLTLLALITVSGLPMAQLEAAEVAPDVPDATVARALPRYLESRSARFIDWLADGSMLVATRFGDSQQIHRVSMPLGAREQRSFEPGGVLAAAAQPQHNQAFLYLAPHAGSLGTALLWQPQAGQPAIALTDGSARDGAAVWAHDGQRLAFASTRGAGHEREIELLDTAAIASLTSAPPAASAATAAAPAARLIAGGAGYRWRVFDWSPDDQRLLLGRESIEADADAELFTADVASGALTAIEAPRAATPAAAHGAQAKPRTPPATIALQTRLARFAPDGRGLLLLRSAEGGAGADFWQLQRFDPVSGDTQVLSSESSRDVELFDESSDGHYLAYTSNEGGTSRLALIDQQRKLDLTVRDLPPGIISNLKFDPAGQRLALTIETSTAPRDVYVLEPATQQLTRWTQSELGPIEAAGLVTPALVRYPTWDRVDGQPRMLSAFSYRPPKPAALHPVLILLRSGAGTQFRPGFDPLVQFLVNELQFVVLAPNVRGAAGYGRSFIELGQGALRDDAARDVGSLLVWIGLQHDLDFNHIMVLGEGYSSSLALSCLAQYGDRLRGGVAAFLPHIGPMSNAASIRRPVLLVQGGGNPEAPAYEAEQLAARLRANGAPVEYLAAADEAGVFRRKSNQDAYYTAAANFLAQLTR